MSTIADERQYSANAASDAATESHRLRKEALELIASGEITPQELVELSRNTGNGALGGKAYLRIRLIDIMYALGWSKELAGSALIKNGFGKKDTVNDIRKHTSNTNAFLMLLRLGTERWAPKPKLSLRFPKEGSLMLVMQSLVDDGFVFPPSVAATVSRIGGNLDDAYAEDYHNLLESTKPENHDAIVNPRDSEPTPPASPVHSAQGEDITIDDDTISDMFSDDNSDTIMEEDVGEWFADEEEDSEDINDWFTGE